MAKHPDYYTGRMGNRLFQIAFLYAQIRKGNIPDWYLQNEEYFKGYEEEIKDLFGHGIGYLTQVGVHVRRGSNPINPEEPKYSDNPYYVNLADNTDYYERAMAMFPNDKFLIFSDDPDYCRERFKGDNIQVMDKGDEVEDFNMLASCCGVIGANSSWSWWAGYLCSYPNAKIVFPSVKNWYSDGIERTFCPQHWIRI